MHVTDFDYFGIDCVSKEDIEATGAKLADVNVFTMISLQDFVDDSEIKFKLSHNGMTTGNHSSPLHPKGLAVDLDVIGLPKMYVLWKKAIIRFGGVGVYWNGKAYSMHLDKRPESGYWSGIKKQDGAWKYGGIFLDPQDL